MSNYKKLIYIGQFCAKKSRKKYNNDFNNQIVRLFLEKNPLIFSFKFQIPNISQIPYSRQYFDGQIPDCR